MFAPLMSWFLYFLWNQKHTHVCIFTIFFRTLWISPCGQQLPEKLQYPSKQRTGPTEISPSAQIWGSSQNNIRYEQLNFIKISKSVPKRLKIKEFPPNYLPHTTYTVRNKWEECEHCAGSKGKKVDLSFSEQLLRLVFQLFEGKIFIFLIFKNILATALKSYIK